MTLLKEKSEKHDLHVNYCQSFYLHLKKIIHTQMFIYKATYTIKLTLYKLKKKDTILLN